MKVITIGRNKGNDVIIGDDDKVSRHHLQIVQFDDGSYQLIDFNSTNGTYVNGNRVQGEASLDESDFVRIGDTMLPWTTYFDPSFVSQAQVGFEGNAAVTKDRDVMTPEPPTEKTNIFAILGLILAFVVPPVGLVFSILGLVMSKKYGDKQKGMAIAGLIISIIFTLVLIVYIIILSTASAYFY